MTIDYLAVPTEKLVFPDNTFDVITACQCFWYFDHKRVMPNLAGMLKAHGRLLILYMAWKNARMPWCWSIFDTGRII